MLVVAKIWNGMQDSANNSTPLCYSSKTHRFGNYSCMNLWKSRPSYSTWVRVEYLYCRRIWWILVESSRTEVVVFLTIYGHSQIIIRLWPIYRRYSCHYRIGLHYITINFTIRLRLDLGHRLLVFALTTNLELGPSFADIWIIHKLCNADFIQNWPHLSS